ncbi:MAG TPA: ethanolamine ammonia-lyase light chain EutC [Gemmatimonadales bacterium]|nr:ethanolamine ammonia-lyase light chain EutC [Gemmatimonadales bacterium]
MDVPALIGAIEGAGLQAVHVRSAAPDRAALLADPASGDRLHPESLTRLRAQSGVGRDAVFVVADGVAPRAVEAHAVPVLKAAVPRLEAAGWSVGPVVVAEQGRVPLGDAIGAAVGAHLAVVLLGEAAGADAPESLGIYVTWDPAPGRTAEQRNRVSDVRAGGVSARAAATRLLRLMTDVRARRQSGTSLDDESGASDA